MAAPIGRKKRSKRPVSVQVIAATLLWTLPPGGVGFVKFRFGFRFCEMGWAFSFPNGIFISPDGLYGRHRPEEKHTVRRAITKNSGSLFRRFPLLGLNRTGAGCRSCYFQSLNISSIALSIAAFRLFSTMRLSSA